MPNYSPDVVHALVSKGREQVKSELKKGDKVYIFSTIWFLQWEKFIKNGGDNPGPIDNYPIASLVEAGLIREGCLEGQDYLMLPEFTYKILKAEYGGDQHFLREVSFLFSCLNFP